MYKWIFVSTYKYYSKFKNESPRFGAAAVVTVSQFTIVFLILTLLERQMLWNFTKYVPNKFIGLPIVFGWMAIIYRYYSQERINILSKNFDELPKWKRIFWGVISVVFFVLPLILFGFAASKT
jgi:hypothetical protein